MPDDGATTILYHAPAGDARRLRTGAVRLPSGLRLPYAERGDPAGPPVLLLHGFTDSWRSFTPLLHQLPEGLRAVAVTQRGHGDADRPEAGYGPGDLAADLAAFAEGLGLGPAVVVGHCMGAQVAQHFALDHPARVRGLVLIGAYPTLRGNPVVREFWDEGVAALADPVDPGFARAFQEGTLARPVPPGFLDMVVAETLKLPAAVWRKALAALMAEPTPAGLGRIAVPTLLLWGDRDGLVSRADQALLEGAIAGARLAVHEGGGHSPHWEDPARVAAEIAEFVAGIGGGA
jgi:non-heme chloroperoxidase